MSQATSITVDSTQMQPPSEDLLREHVYLVARGVRALAIAGWCEADELAMLRAATLVESHVESPALPFVVNHGDGRATYGYAAAAWALDLYQWAHAEQVPQEQRERIVGLLLGYSPEAVARFEDQGTGRRFTSLASRSDKRPVSSPATV